MRAYHFTLAAHWPHTPFDRREKCRDFWLRLQSRFPKILACVLMPNHFHLVIETSRVSRVKRELGIELRAFTRTFYPGRTLWPRAPLPDPVSDDAQHIKRQIRYVHLNPCRAGLAKDPLEWEWSTHRDAVGAAYPSWIDLDRYRSLWRLQGERLSREIHRYTSADPSVDPNGTSFPRGPAGPGFLPLAVLPQAVASAVRGPGELNAELRSLVVQLSGRLAPARSEDLSRLLGVTERRIRMLAAQKPSDTTLLALEAAALVAADPRLLRSGLRSEGENFRSALVQGG